MSWKKRKGPFLNNVASFRGSGEGEPNESDERGKVVGINDKNGLYFLPVPKARKKGQKNDNSTGP